MNHLQPKQVESTYLILMLFNTLAASFIWGINTLFLLDAGLTNAQAFLTNAFFTLGQVIFEIPTGVVADVKGRRTSYLWGTIVLSLSTLLYLYAWNIQAPIWVWMFSSALLGLGFTFFSGATEAWLVDALEHTKHKGKLDDVFARGHTMTGIAMLVGTVAGGYIAQVTNLGVPYILRILVLVINFIIAFFLMHDIGFEPEKGASPIKEVKKIVGKSIELGWKNRPVRWLMLAAPFGSGVGIYIFYAMQPFLLELYGDSGAYGVAGLAAAAVAGAQIVGSLVVPYVRRVFSRRSNVLMAANIISAILIVALALNHNFILAVALLLLWAMTFTASMPVRQAYLNKLIPSKQRATVLSFDSLVSSSGGVVTQPALGRAADVWSYSTSFLIGAVIQVGALPFLLLTRREKSQADKIQ